VGKRGGRNPLLKIFFPISEPRYPTKHWRDANNCREYFDAFAKKHGFDPSIAENWYQKLPDLLEQHVRASLSIIIHAKAHYFHFLVVWCDDIFPKRRTSFGLSEGLSRDQILEMGNRYVSQ